MVYNKTTIFYLYPSYGDAHLWGPWSGTGGPLPSRTEQGGMKEVGEGDPKDHGVPESP